MPRIHAASARKPTRAFYTLGVISSALVLAATACGKTDKDAGTPASAGAGAGGAAPHAGASGVAGGSTRPSGGAGGAAGAPIAEAGAGGTAEGGAADTGEAGAAGAAAEPVVCQPGGTLFVVGNYVNAAGDELFLRSTASAATLAVVPKAPAAPAQPPQLFAVERVCAPGGALVARDATSRYRVDFAQSGSQFAFCMSPPVPTLDAAANLPPADVTHAADTGCSGQPFKAYTAEAL
jgi:hypothetical protein